MAGETPNPTTPESVTISASELARLHEAAKSAEVLERDTATSIIERDLAAVLADQTLVQGGTAHLMRLLKDDFKATREDGRWVVKSLDGRSLGDHVKDQLARPEFAMFKKAGHAGGGGGGNTPPANGGERPASYGEQLIRANAGRPLGMSAFRAKYAANK